MPRRGLLIWLIILPILAFLTASIIRRISPGLPDNIPGVQIFNQTSNGSQTVEFLCRNNESFRVEFPLQYETEGVSLTLPSEQTFELNQIEEVSGITRYTNGQYTFYIQNGEGFVEANNIWVYAGCDPQSEIPEPAPPPTPTPSPSPSPTVTPTPSPSPTATPSPSPSPSPVPPVSPTPSPNPNAILYICQDRRQFQVTFFSNQAELILEGNLYYLSQVPSGSGSRYTDGQIILNAQGNQSSIEFDGFVQYDNCIAQATPNPSPLPAPIPRPPNAMW